jgi:hypothetical protein
MEHVVARLEAKQGKFIGRKKELEDLNLLLKKRTWGNCKTPRQRDGLSRASTLRPWFLRGKEKVVNIR